MHAEAVNDWGAGLIETEHFNLGALAAEPDHDLIQRCDGGDIPKMRVCEIDGDFVESFLEVKKFSELVRSAKVHLATTW